MLGLRVVDNHIITNNGYEFYFDKGKIDNYRVHCINHKTKKDWFALDKEYLAWIKRMGNRYDNDSVYNDFVRLYDAVEYDYDFNNIIGLINELDSHYHNQTQKWWVVFYMTMIAEEHKEGAILGKRIKRLGVYNVLFDGYSAEYTAHYMKDMSWIELDKLMSVRGF